MGDLKSVRVSTLIYICRHSQCDQIRSTFFAPTAVLKRSDSVARMTVSGCVTAINIEMDSFTLALCQPIKGIPGFSPLTVRVTVGYDENFERPQVSFPQLHSLISLTGDILAMEHRVAYLSVNFVALMCPFNHNFDLASHTVPQSLLL